MRRTKIVCTLGPTSNSVGELERMLEAGMNVARFNFSHGSHAEHTARLENLRKAAAGTPVGVLQDLSGPKIRAGEVEPGGVVLETGAMLEIVSDPAGELIGSSERVATGYEHFAEDVMPGDKVLIDDGTIRLRVVEKSGRKVRCAVEVGGKLFSHKGMNLPGVNISAPSVTEKDLDDLQWGLAHGVDYVALSFVRSPDDILKVREACAGTERPPQIVAKIERPEAIERLEEIVAAADALMVARGDLGVEMDAEEVPLLQKRIIEIAHRSDKPVITATQMLDSMIRNPRPTRAEVSDVAGAIFDHTDAVMLSGETAAGAYPVESVETMARIAERTEKYMFEKKLLKTRSKLVEVSEIIDAVCVGAGSIVDNLCLPAVVVTSHTGRTARFMSMARPRAVIVGLTVDSRAVGRMCLYWGVEPVVVNTRFTDRQGLADAVEEALSKIDGPWKPGDMVVATHGVPLGEAVPTNTVTLHRLGTGSE